jgi:hypothetical protein
MNGPWWETSPLEVDDGKIVPNLNPPLGPSSSSAMDSLKEGCFRPLATRPPLRADPPLLVFEVQGEMGPPPPVLKGLQVELDFVVPD